MSQKIRFMTDSASDIPADLQKEYDILVVPFMIAMGDRELRDCVDFTQKEFYSDLLASETIPTHSQINPAIFEEIYEQTLEAGYTDLIYTCINAKGSATYRNALLSRDSFYEDHPEAAGKLSIHILDSKTYTFAYGYAIVEGAKLAREGKPVEEVISFMQDWLDNNRILFATYSLRFAKKSGRVSAAAAFLGDALGLKPIMSFPDGESKVLDKVRGEKKVIPAIIKMMQEEIDPDSPVILILAGLDDKNEEMRKAIVEATGKEPVYSSYIGGVIAINAGPELTGVIFRKKKQ